MRTAVDTFSNRAAGLCLSVLLLLSAAAASTSATPAEPTLTLHADLFSEPNALSGGGVDAAIGFDRRHVFVTSSREEGAELWVSDGTPAGTRRLADICPGVCSGAPRDLSVVGDRMYFSANDGVHGREPWMLRAGSDTPEMLADLYPGLNGSVPRRIQSVAMTAGIPAQSRVFFSARRPDVGYELFRIENDVVVLDTDVNPGPDGSFATRPVPFGDRMLLTIVEDINSGTILPRVLQYPADLSPPATVVPLAGYPQNEGLHQHHPEAYPAGVGPVVLMTDQGDLWAATRGNLGSNLLAFGPVAEITSSGTGKVFYIDGFDRRLHATDGTIAGTQTIGPTGSSELTVIGPGAVAFFAELSGASDREVFLSFGSAGTTGLIDEIVPGSGGLSPDDQLLAAADGSRVYLSRPEEIWVLDPDNGAQRIAEFPGMVERPLLFAGDAHSVLFADAGREPNISDGIVDDARRLSNVRSDSGHSFAHPVGVVNGRVIADAVIYPGLQPQAIAVGTVDSTQLDEVSGGRLVGPGLRVGTHLAAETAAGNLLLTNGRASGSVQKSLGAFSLFPGCVVRDGQSLVFSAQVVDGSIANDYRLYRTDGTSPGTVVELNYEALDGFSLCGSTHAKLARIGDDLFFPGIGVGSGQELLRLADGVVGTVADIHPGLGGSNPGNLVALDDRLLFTADDNLHGEELWVSDGSSIGTQLLIDLVPGGRSSRITQLQRVGNRVVFMAEIDDDIGELWSTDGSAAGTRLLRDIAPGPGGSIDDDDAYFDNDGQQLLFRAAAPIGSPDHGCPLFITDGTPAGTRCAQNRDGPSPPVPMSPATVAAFTANGSIVFVSADAASGEEIRVLRDGVLVPIPGGDLQPGSNSSGAGYGSNLVVDGNVVYFGANGGSGGYELYRLDVSSLGPIFVDGFEN